MGCQIHCLLCQTFTTAIWCSFESLGCCLTGSSNTIWALHICMTGSGEASSHVTAFLFNLEINSLHKNFFTLLLVTTITSGCNLLRGNWRWVYYSKTEKKKSNSDHCFYPTCVVFPKIETTTHQMKKTYIFLKDQAFILRVFVSNLIYNMGGLYFNICWYSNTCAHVHFWHFLSKHSGSGFLFTLLKKEEKRRKVQRQDRENAMQPCFVI